MQDFITNSQKTAQTIPFILENIPLSDKNWFRTGGTARFYCEPKTQEQFRQAVLFALTQDLEIFILGSGANILISDEGFNGLVIKPQLTQIKKIGLQTKNKFLVCAQAGVLFHDLITECLSNNLLGLEEFSGIPGTVGGSVYINIHYFEFLLSNFLVSAQILHKKTAEIREVDTDWFAFGYDQSKLQSQDYYLLSATFALRLAGDLETHFARGRHHEIIRHRNQRYPRKNTCGSFFRNFYENEVTCRTSDGKKNIFVGYYLDKLGIKGELAIGDAQVSHQHANMIINRGTAQTRDIIALARCMQEKVRDAYGITPQPECQLIGFNSYPLYL